MSTDKPDNRIQKRYISQHSGKIRQLDDGNECYFVEVTRLNGTQRGISAYRLEANDLQKTTLSIPDSNKMSYFTSLLQIIL
jgi:hypothetical protein